MHRTTLLLIQSVCGHKRHWCLGLMDVIRTPVFTRKQTHAWTSSACVRIKEVYSSSLRILLMINKKIIVFISCTGSETVVLRLRRLQFAHGAVCPHPTPREQAQKEEAGLQPGLSQTTLTLSLRHTNTPLLAMLRSALSVADAFKGSRKPKNATTMGRSLERSLRYCFCQSGN